MEGGRRSHDGQTKYKTKLKGKVLRTCITQAYLCGLTYRHTCVVWLTGIPLWSDLQAYLCGLTYRHTCVV